MRDRPGPDREHGRRGWREREVQRAAWHLVEKQPGRITHDPDHLPGRLLRIVRAYGLTEGILARPESLSRRRANDGYGDVGRRFGGRKRPTAHNRQRQGVEVGRGGLHQARRRGGPTLGAQGGAVAHTAERQDIRGGDGRDAGQPGRPLEESRREICAPFCRVRQQPRVHPHNHQSVRIEAGIHVKRS